MVVVINIMYQKRFIQNWRELFLGMLLAQQILNRLVISALLLISLLSVTVTLLVHLESVLLLNDKYHPNTMALISPKNLSTTVLQIKFLAVFFCRVYPNNCNH